MILFPNLLALLIAGHVKQVPYYQDANVTLNVFDNGTSSNYFTHDFLRNNAVALKAIRYPNGLGCTFALSQDSRTIRGICSDQVQREYLVSSDRHPTIPTAQAMDFDQDGNMAVVDGRYCYLYTLSGDRNTATLGKTFMVPMPGNVASVLLLDGLTSQGQKYQRLAIATKDGFVGIFGMDGKRDTIWRLPNDGVDGRVMRLFGDGHSTNGVFDFYAAGLRRVAPMGWWTLRWNPDLRTLNFGDVQAMKYDTSSGTLVHPTTEFPRNVVASNLVPIYHGTSDPTILVLVAQGDIYEFSADGIYISTPLKQCDVDGSGMLIPSKTLPRVISGDPPQLTSCNTRDNWQQCLDLVSSGDFHGGCGLKRFSYTPDNYGAFIPVDLHCIRADHSGDDLTKPLIGIKNISFFDAIHGPKIRLFGSRQEMSSQQVVADLYYSRIPGVSVSTGYLDANPNIWWTDIAYPTNFVLKPGDSIATTDLQLGIHFQGYYPGIWDATNDWSFNGPTSLRAAVYGWDSASRAYILVGGAVPDPSVAPLPVQHPVSAVLSLAASQWAVQSGNATLQAVDSGLLANLQGYSMVASQPMDPKTLNFSQGTISIQYELLSPLPNPWWPGALDLSFDSPMNGIYSQYVGHVDIASTVNQTQTAQFPLPAGVAGRMWTASDFRILLALNGPPGTRLVIQKITLP